MADFLFETGFLKHVGGFSLRTHPLLPALVKQYIHPIALAPPEERTEATSIPSGRLYLRRLVRRNGFASVPEFHTRPESKFRSGPFAVAAIAPPGPTPSPAVNAGYSFAIEEEEEEEREEDVVVLVGSEDDKDEKEEDKGEEEDESARTQIERFDFLLGWIPVNFTSGIEDWVSDPSSANGDEFPVAFPVEDLSFVLDAAQILGEAAAVEDDRPYRKRKRGKVEWGESEGGREERERVRKKERVEWKDFKPGGELEVLKGDEREE